MGKRKVAIAFIFVGVVAAIAYFAVDLSGRVPAPARVMASASRASETDPDLRTLYRTLINARIEEELAKRLLLADLAVPVARTENVYWRLGDSDAADSRLKEFARRAAYRRALLSLFGQAAPNDPAFSSLFRPYENKYPFLTAEKQVVLEDVEFTIQREMLGLEAASTDVSAGRYEKLISRRKELASAVLTADELFEYELRESPLAQRLRRTGFDFSQEEFRAVFKTIKADERLVSRLPFTMAPIGTDSTEMLAAPLSAALGKQRFSRFLRIQDPLYRTLTSHARRYGVTLPQIEAAYDILAESRRREMSLPRGVATAQIESIRSARNEAIKSALGEDLAAEILSKLSAVRSPPPGAFIVTGG